MFSILNHKGNGNQNDTKIPSYPRQNGYHQENNKYWQVCREKETLILCCWECKLVQPLWTLVWRFLKKLKIELPYDPTTPLLGIHPKECELTYSRDTYTPMFIVVVFTIAKLWNQPST
jgi:hypothetical protein